MPKYELDSGLVQQIIERDLTEAQLDRLIEALKAQDGEGQEVYPAGYLTQAFAPHFMGVVVGIPSQGGGATELYTFGRSGYLGEPITGVDRLIVDALLSHAKTSLYTQGNGVQQYPQVPNYPGPY